ncbi:hypothetical protein K493DRAFT_11972 [Basidiobolus meristosporus CBS 931.73]|uniref:Uncharacterized protein n=1 Tax=Basidiobolus meristosporus CBS 931.73 TaxID=1314790 RepID=A0A1Y1VRE0_9FUNG|nr:hypothetical protein K493DRAFT_11972 [Basidiobolus meristosporus CBS 931.73]|eukprot:ORX63837.1 hypothetical protein K493DRAFT_11972 [Basidiobolus meristosporus CBS 931.73]
MAQPPSKNLWDGDKMLNIYIYDYCLKRNWNGAAQAFLEEAQVAPDSQVPIDSPHGFLYEWWVVFWDIFSARTNKTGSKDAQSFVEGQIMKAQRNQSGQPQMQKLTGQQVQLGSNTSSAQSLHPNVSQIGGSQTQPNIANNPNVNSLRLNLTAKPNSPIFHNLSQSNQNPSVSATANAISPPQTSAQLPGNGMAGAENNGPQGQGMGQGMAGPNAQMQPGAPGMRGGVNPMIVQQIMQTLGLAGRDPSTLNNNEKVR